MPTRNTFDTTNIDALVYKNEILGITVLGGIKIEGLDRMRATLKVELLESARPAVRHNLDLYNDNQLEKFIRKVAERHEIGTGVIEASLAELIENLEEYRIKKQLEQAEPSYVPPTVSVQEREKATAFLSEPELLKRTGELLQESGIIGESINALILYLSMSSRQCEDPLSVVCLAKSGTGKSYLMERVAACMPKEDLLENTQFTENSFYYFKREEIKGKVFLIEDLDGAESVLYPIRELQSKKRITKTVTVKDKNGQMRTINLIVEGPVSVIGCTTKEKIYEDNANRSILLYLDHSREQDERILDYQKRLKAGLVDKEKEKEIQLALSHVQRLLKPVKIINPYAPLINLPKEVFKPRRTMTLLLNFIESLTYYHQGQRTECVNKETGEVYIESTPEDIKNGFELLKETLFRKSDELSGATRSLFEWLEKWCEERENVPFLSSEIRLVRKVNPRTLQRHLKELVEYDYLIIVGGNRHKGGYQYQLIKGTTRKDIEGVIDHQITAIMKKVEHAHKKIIGKKEK